MRRLLTFVCVLAASVLAACGGSPTEPDPHMVFLSPRPQAQLKIGETIVIQWQCVECADIKGDRAIVRLTTTQNGSAFTNHGEVAAGFLNDSRAWVVGQVKTPDRGMMTMQPGFYYLNVYSFPPPSETSWTEATSGFDGVLIELVK